MVDSAKLKHILQISTDGIWSYLFDTLERYYTKDKVIVAYNYMLAKGDVPIWLVAHVDTVLRHRLDKVYYDAEEQVMFGSEGLGADDRAGVFAILHLLEKGYRPNIIFTDGEERGGIGAMALVKNFPKCPFKNVKYLIEIDRQGRDEFVTYDCANPEFDKYISSFGWQKKEGLFTDISIIAPQWGIAACNISAGYLNEHTLGERLHVNWLEETIDKLEKMIAVSGQASSFDYIEAPKGSWTASTDLVKCGVCEKLEPIADIEWVTVGTTQLPMCSSCQKILSVHKCKKCNELFWDIDHEDYCPVCKNFL